MFVDQVKINVKAGNGGNGMVAFDVKSMSQMVDRPVVMVAVAETSFLRSTQDEHTDGLSISSKIQSQERW